MITAIVLVVLGAIGAIKAGIAGADFMFDLEQVKPALATTPPTIVDAGTPRLARRVVLVIVDGLRLDKSYELPYLDELRRRGVDLEASTHYPTWSRPNYVSILTGVYPTASGVRTNHHATPVLLDSLMDRAHAAGLRVAMGTDYDVLPGLFLRTRAQFKKVDPDAELDLDIDRPTAPDTDLVSPFDDARYAPWPGGFVEAGSALVAGEAELVVLLVGAVDAAGHKTGGASTAYRAAAESSDRAIARALARIDLTQDAVVITADHGHTDRGGHGGLEPEVLAVPLILAGAGVKPGTPMFGAQLVDVAPTIAALLGIAAPGHGLGRTLVDVLALDDAARAKRRATDAARLAITQQTFAHAREAAEAAVASHRTGRLELVCGGVVVALALLALGWRRRWIRLEWRVLVVSVPAFFIVYYGLLGTFGQGFSPSFLPANGHMATQLAKYGVAGVVVQLLAGGWVLRGRASFDARLAAANGIAWLGLFVSITTAGLLWAYVPPPFDSVPGPVMLVLIPAVEIAVAAIALGVALTLAIELVIFAARAWSGHGIHSKP